MSARPRILILHASGVNRDGEAARACEMAGGAPEIVHLNRLRKHERHFADYQMLLLPGGFSYGDALGAGARLALDMRVFFEDQLREFVASGKLVLGICNGFQTLVKAGLLPGETADDGRPTTDGRELTTHPTPREVTLTYNANGRFECRWVHLAVNRNAAASFLRDIDDLIFCPVAHGEGNFQVKDDATLAELERNNLIAFRYVDADGEAVSGEYPLNPNGSAGDIAGICNRRGNVVGLMPHPEDHLTAIQNPLDQRNHLGLSLFSAMIGSL